MKRIIVTGIGTGVGKTVCSAILLKLLSADYWKPVETGSIFDSDPKTIQHLFPETIIHSPTYSFKEPLSPHHAARLEQTWIDPALFQLPSTDRNLIIETAGGPLAPLTNHVTSLDVFSQWNSSWIVVANCYLGSIHHTLSTIEVLKARKCDLKGLIFNGDFLKESEEAILGNSKLPLIGRIAKEAEITAQHILKYVGIWKQNPLWTEI